jgi:type IV secretion system protein VirB11
MSEAEALLPRSAAVQVADRQLRMLKSAFGIHISAALEDPEVIEIMVNPDGALWLDRLKTGRAPTGITLSEASTERIIRLVAAHIHIEVHANAPIISAELPDTQERFEGLLPPIVRAPAFSIRKRAIEVISLGRYVEEHVMTASQAQVLRQAVRDHQNILIAGGTSTGKTTLANALLSEIAETQERVLLLEDTVELQCTAQDRVSLRTQAGIASMTQLVRSTLRLRPDRIIVGEVRGGEALDLLKAWGTGHPGGLATIHAGSARGALHRLEQLIQEVVTTVPRALIAETINVIVFIAGRNRARRVQDIVRVTGLDANGYHLEPMVFNSGDAS